MIKQKGAILFFFIEHSWCLCYVDRGSCCNRNEEVYSKWFGLYHLGKDQGDNIVMLQEIEWGARGWSHPRSCPSPWAGHQVWQERVSAVWRSKSCHLWKHRWTWGTWCWVKEAGRRRTNMAWSHIEKPDVDQCRAPLICGICSRKVHRSRVEGGCQEWGGWEWGEVGARRQASVLHDEEVLEIHHTARGLPQSTFFSMLLSVIDKLVRYSECSLRWFDLHVRCERIPPPQLVKLSHLSPHKYIVYLKFTKRESFKDSHHKNPTNCVRWWTCWSASSWWSLHRVCVY